MAAILSLPSTGLVGVARLNWSAFLAAQPKAGASPRRFKEIPGRMVRLKNNLEMNWWVGLGFGGVQFDNIHSMQQRVVLFQTFTSKKHRLKKPHQFLFKKHVFFPSMVVMAQCIVFSKIVGRCHAFWRTSSITRSPQDQTSGVVGVWKLLEGL